MDHTRIPYSCRSAVIRGIHRQLQSRRIGPDPPLLSPTQLCQLINTVFWASLATEEGHLATVALTVLSDEDASWQSIAFADTFPLSPFLLAKLSPSVQLESCYLTVILPDRGRPRLSGILEGATSTPVIRAISPGTILVSVAGEILAHLSPVEQPSIPQVPNWVFQVARFVSASFTPDFEMAWCLRFLAAAMRHGCGGTILIVPQRGTGWTNSLKDGYVVATDNLRIVERKKAWERASKDTTEPESPVYLDPTSSEATTFRRAAALIGRLTAIDGATILNHKYQVLGFGRKILPKAVPPTVIQVADLLLEAGGEALPFEKIGGTRHQSAACFANEHADSVALVTSQDGRMTLFRKTDGELRALRRCEALLPAE